LVALPQSAKCADILQASVQRVDGGVIYIDVGSNQGVAYDDRFQVVSRGKVIRIPLTGTVAYQEGRPFAVLQVKDVQATSSRCLVASIDAGERIVVGLDAVRVPVSAGTTTDTPPTPTPPIPPTPTTIPTPPPTPDPVKPDNGDLGALTEKKPDPKVLGPSALETRKGMSISADPGQAKPGQKVRLSVVGIPEGEVGFRVRWKVSSGWLSATETATASVTWIAPRSAGQHEIEISVRLASGKTYAGSGLIEVAGEVQLSERIELEKVYGYFAYEGGREPLRIMDLAFDTENSMYILDPRLRNAYRMEQGGKVEETATRETFASANVREPRAIATYSNKVYVLDTVVPFVKVFEKGKFAGKMGDNVPVGDPVDVTVDLAGQTYVVDRNKRCFHIFDNRGYYLHQRGRKGKRLGEFLLPVAIANSPQGTLYVLDQARRDVQIFDKGFRVSAKLDLRVQPGNDLLDIDVAPDGKSFYVLEGPHSAIARYNNSGELMLYSAQDQSRFPDLPKSCARLALDSLGRVHVVPRSREGIFRYSAVGRSEGSFAATAPGKPMGIDVDHQGNFTVLDASSPHIRLYDSEGWMVGRFGEPVNLPVPFRMPRKICMLRTGMRPVTLGLYARGAFDAPVDIPAVNVFSKSGERLRSAGTRGTGPGQFTRPTDIAADLNENIYVLDQDILKVSMYSAKGVGETPERERNFSRGKRLPHELIAPTVLAVDSETSDMYVYDAKTRLIKKYSKDAVYLASLGGDTGFVSVERMKVAHLGFLWVFDRKLQELRRIDFREKTGSVLLTFSLRQKIDNLVIDDVIDFGLDASGRIYLLSARDLIYQFR
jgi:DNA-binding beta-propeller fold protein YncE